MQRHIDSTRSRPRFTALFVSRIAADDSARRTLDLATTAVFTARAAKAADWFDPTLAANEAMIRVNDPSVRDRPEMKYVPWSARTFGHGPPPVANASASPAEAIQAATRNAADAAGKLRQVGTVEVGKTADLILLDADPLANIGNTRRISTVVTRGRVLDRATLDRMLTEAEAFAKRR